jgi:mono/diheme cytochrome c family protein
MSRSGLVLCLLLATGAPPAIAQEVSVEEGLRVSRIGGCHDCHTQGFPESGGQIDPALALTGSAVGFQGPWGTTYPSNLRLVLAPMAEDEFVDYAKALQTRPPMPWFNLHYMTDGELRSFYRYVKSLGEPGEAAPAYAPPGQAPTTPFIVFAPPQMPG